MKHSIQNRIKSNVLLPALVWEIRKEGKTRYRPLTVSQVIPIHGWQNSFFREKTVLLLGGFLGFWRVFCLGFAKPILLRYFTSYIISQINLLPLNKSIAFNLIIILKSFIVRPDRVGFQAVRTVIGRR